MQVNRVISPTQGTNHIIKWLWVLSRAPTTYFCILINTDPYATKIVKAKIFCLII